jgi:hypothetical protein
MRISGPIPCPGLEGINTKNANFKEIPYRVLA